MDRNNLRLLNSLTRYQAVMDKEIRNVSMDDLTAAWEGFVEELTELWHEQLCEEVHVAMLDLDFVRNDTHGIYYDEGMEFIKNDIACIIYVDRPDTVNHYSCNYHLSAQLSKDEGTTELSFDIEADTITQLLVDIQIKLDLLLRGYSETSTTLIVHDNGE